MYTSKLLLLCFIFLATLFSIVNIGKVICRDYVSPHNTILNAIGIVGIIAYFI